jgi:hypothetical protein
VVGEVFGGISALKAAFDMTKTLVDMSDAAKRDRLSINLQKEILSALATQSELAEEVSSLKAKLTSFETWDTEKKKYELKNLGWSTFAYMLKAEARGSTPPHWICTRCYEDGHTEIIQQARRGNVVRGHGMAFFCPRCEATIDPSAEAFEQKTGQPKWID